MPTVDEEFRVWDDEYEAWYDWYTSGPDQQEIEHQQEVEEYPLFFWRSTCKEIKQ